MKNGLSNLHLIDLSHKIHPKIPVWGGCGFQHNKTQYPEKDVTFDVHDIAAPLGIGTHMDAPSHCCPSGHSVNEVIGEQFIFPVAVLHVPTPKHSETYVLTREDLLAFERLHGRIPAGCLFALNTGWCKRWENPDAYINHYQFPIYSEEAAHFLLDRDVFGIMTDTLSPDKPDSGYPVHKTILGAGKIIIENVNNLDMLPAQDAYAILAPVPLADASEAPVRLLVCLPSAQAGTVQFEAEEAKSSTRP